MHVRLRNNCGIAGAGGKKGKVISKKLPVAKSHRAKGKPKQAKQPRYLPHKHGVYKGKGMGKGKSPGPAAQGGGGGGGDTERAPGLTDLETAQQALGNAQDLYSRWCASHKEHAHAASADCQAIAEALEDARRAVRDALSTTPAFRASTTATTATTATTTVTKTTTTTTATKPTTTTTRTSATATTTTTTKTTTKTTPTTTTPLGQSQGSAVGLHTLPAPAVHACCSGHQNWYTDEGNSDVFVPLSPTLAATRARERHTHRVPPLHRLRTPRDHRCVHVGLECVRNCTCARL